MKFFRNFILKIIGALIGGAIVSLFLYAGDADAQRCLPGVFLIAIISSFPPRFLKARVFVLLALTLCLVMIMGVLFALSLKSAARPPVLWLGVLFFAAGAFHFALRLRLQDEAASKDAGLFVSSVAFVAVGMYLVSTPPAAGLHGVGWLAIVFFAPGLVLFPVRWMRARARGDSA